MTGAPLAHGRRIAVLGQDYGKDAPEYEAGSATIMSVGSAARATPERSQNIMSRMTAERPQTITHRRRWTPAVAALLILIVVGAGILYLRDTGHETNSTQQTTAPAAAAPLPLGGETEPLHDQGSAAPNAIADPSVRGGVAERIQGQAPPPDPADVPSINDVTGKIYVAASQAEAEAFRDYLNGIYAAFTPDGKAPDVQILVAETVDDLNRIRAAVYEENAIRAPMGASDIQVIDLQNR